MTDPADTCTPELAGDGKQEQAASAAYEAGRESVRRNPPPPISESEAVDIRARLRRRPDPDARQD